MTTGLLLSLGWRRAVKLQSQMEFAVLSSMEDAARSGAREAVQDAIESMTRRNPWPVELSEIAIPARGEVVGRTLRQLNLRSQTGATVVAVQRGGVTHYDVPPDLPLSPDDHLLLVAEKAQLVAAGGILSAMGDGGAGRRTLPHIFTRQLVTAGSSLCGLTLSEAAVRSTYGVSVVGLQRGNDRITGPSPDECLQDGDLLLVMGDEAGVKRFREALL